MVQIYRGGEDPRDSSTAVLIKALGQGLNQTVGTYFTNKALNNVLEDPSLKNAPQSVRMSKLQQAMAPYGEKGRQLIQDRMQIDKQQAMEKEEETKLKSQEAISKLINGETLTPAEKKFISPEHQLKFAEISQREKLAGLKPPPGGVSAQPVPTEINQKIGQVLGNSKNMSADQLKQAFDSAEIPPTFTSQYVENRRRSDEQQMTRDTAHSGELRKETFPARKEISDKAEASRAGIENKEHLLKLIDQGNLDDPTYAAFAQALPLDLGKRLLSPDTVQYKAGLIDEFTDLRNIFQGQTRVKEIELLEEKIADIYLTDEQKKTILKSRINALKADLIKEEAAAEIEKEMPNLGLLQFRREVDKRAKPKMEAIFNQILDEQNSVIKDAENRKKIPLDMNDPQDKQVAMQILQEVGGDKIKARELAKKKGYTL